MSLFVAGYQLYFFIFKNDDFFRSVGYNPVQRCVATWLLKTMMIGSYYFYQFHARPYFNHSMICQAWIFIMTLTFTWTPPSFNHPNCLVAIYFLENFFFTIGPFINMTSLFNLSETFEKPRGTAIIRYLTDDTIITVIFSFINWYLWKSAHWYTFMGFTPLITFTAMLYRDTMEKNERLDRRVSQIQNLQQAMEEFNRANAQ